MHKSAQGHKRIDLSSDENPLDSIETTEEGDAMKVLDVHEFQQGLERKLNQLTRLESEMKQIETAIQGLTQLEESLKGQGGEALRAFYENCHLPFLEFFTIFKTSFSNVLQEMKLALSSLEPDASGYIRQESLEGEVEKGLNNAKQVTEDLTDETNNIMDQVSDIVSLPNIDDSEVQTGVQDAKRQRNQTLEQLMVFDNTQTSALTTIQTDLMLLKTWITNIESMMTKGVTDVNFPVEQWKTFTLQNPLTQALAYRSQSMNSVVGMNPLLAPGFIGRPNPYTLPGLHQNSQLPLYNFGIDEATVSTNFVSFMKQQEEIATELSCPAPDVEAVKEEENEVLGFLKDVGNGALDVGKGVLDFLILDDLNTLADGDASLLDKGIAAASIIPIGKLLKVPKALDLVLDSNVDDIIKKSDVDEAINKGKDVYGPHYDEAKILHELNPDWYPNPDESSIVKGNELKEARADYHALARRGELEKGHHIQGLAFGGENVNSNIKKTGESTIRREQIDELNLDFYHEMGYGKKDAKVLKIHENEDGIILFGNNPQHTEVTTFQNKVLKWQRENGKR